MALPATMYRFTVNVSDVDRGFYQSLELRIAMQPSETTAYLFTRVLAYCLNYQSGIELTQGIAATEEPAILVKDLTGNTTLWIEVGNPSARRLHKASKAAKRVRVYTYRDAQILLKEVASQEIHRKSELELFSLDPRFLDELAQRLKRDNTWDLLFDHGDITVTLEGQSFQSELSSHPV